MRLLKGKRVQRCEIPSKTPQKKKKTGYLTYVGKTNATLGTKLIRVYPGSVSFNADDDYSKS